MCIQKREKLKEKKRIVIKIGSSSLTHRETGKLNLLKIEKLVRILCDLRGEGRDVVLVSSGAIAAGRQALGSQTRPSSISEKQAYAAVGQARLMMVYQKLFSEYNHVTAQVLLTKNTMIHEASRYNAQNTFDELMNLGVIPIVNENDTVSTHEIQFGDNDRLSAIVSALIGADLLILLSDIEGLYTDDPRKNPDARFIQMVEEITPQLLKMGKDTAGSDVGTGGMSAKLAAARIATDSGSDMVIANGDNVEIIHEIMEGQPKGTLFMAHPNLDFDLMDYIKLKMDMENQKSAYINPTNIMPENIDVFVENDSNDERVRQIKKEYQEELHRIDEILHEQEKAKLREEIQKQKDIIDKLEEEYEIADNLLDELYKKDETEGLDENVSLTKEPVVEEKLEEKPAQSAEEVEEADIQEIPVQEQKQKIASGDIVITPNKKLTLQEAYKLLSSKQNSKPKDTVSVSFNSAINSL